MATYRTIAEAYHRALEADLVSAAEVVAWVDGVIIVEPSPAFAFLEASSAGLDPGAVLKALRDVPGVTDDGTRRRLIFGLMTQALDREPAEMKKIVHTLFNMAIDGDVPNAAAEACMMRLDDAMDLAEQGIYGCVDDVRRDLTHFLAQYGEAI